MPCPGTSRPRRWALTPPFHPCPHPLPQRGGSRWRSILCGTFQGLPPLGFPRAACPAESGPSSGEESPATPRPSPPPQASPRIAAARAHPNYTAYRTHPAQRPAAARANSPRQKQKKKKPKPSKNDELPGEIFRRNSRPLRLQKGGQKPGRKLDRGVSWSNPVGLRLRLLPEFLQLPGEGES